jgi:hypothetical protein
MSSATSTKEVRLKPDTAGTARVSGAAPDDHADAGLQPWQFFVLAALGCATAITFVARGQGPIAIVLLSVLIGTAAFVGYTTLGERTRVALEREKLLTLRSIKELEFDRAMGRLSDEDFTEMAGRLRLRAARLIKQLDSGSTYRDQIEKDLAKRLGTPAPPEGSGGSPVARTASGGESLTGERTCASCQTANDEDAKFCKRCGAPLAER